MSCPPHERNFSSREKSAMTERDRWTDATHGSPAASNDVENGKTMREHVDSAERIEDEASDGGSSEDGSIDFQQLAHGRREVLVRLAGQTYRLRWTRNDKLILTK